MMTAQPSPHFTMKKRRRWKLPVSLFFLLTIGVTVGAVMFLRRPSVEAKYLAALADSGALSDFQTERAAVLHAQATCEEFDTTGEPKGGRAEELATEYYCEQWADDFRRLETATIHGKFSIRDIDEYILMDDGDPCEGEGGYGDINASTQVVVTNGEGDNLARTSLGQGRISSFRCVYDFEFEATEGEDMYVVAVGRRGETDYTFDELKMGPDLSLG